MAVKTSRFLISRQKKKRRKSRCEEADLVNILLTMKFLQGRAHFMYILITMKKGLRKYLPTYPLWVQKSLVLLGLWAFSFQNISSLVETHPGLSAILIR